MCSSTPESSKMYVRGLSVTSVAMFCAPRTSACRHHLHLQNSRLVSVCSKRVMPEDWLWAVSNHVSAFAIALTLSVECHGFPSVEFGLKYRV